MADDARIETKTAEEVIRLWPDGPPRGLPETGGEQSFRQSAGYPDGPVTTMLRNVDEPTLTVYRPDAVKANDVGVIVAPGGGWRILAWEHEGVDIAKWLAERGYTAFLLKYRVTASPRDPKAFADEAVRSAERVNRPYTGKTAPRSLAGLLAGNELLTLGREIAADDGRRALETARQRAGEFGLKRFGMIGFSAGAFLTVDVAMDPGGPPLDFIAPIYGGETNARPVPADAPALFTCIAQDDLILFKVVEGLYRDWSDADRPAELHIFRRGGHGFGMVKQAAPVDRWIDLFGDWLIDLGFG
ncbi:MAG TPA: dienelactone hydrolase family protein [Caulobacteraceae bacterium]|nr:dienelactone hydrolase family protein [Caulobacteraceae bacterium]